MINNQSTLRTLWTCKKMIHWQYRLVATVIYIQSPRSVCVCVCVCTHTHTHTHTHTSQYRDTGRSKGIKQIGTVVDAACQDLSACHRFATLVLGDTATSQIKEISCLTLPPIPISSKLFLPFRCSHQSFVGIPLVFYAFHRSRLPPFDLSVTICSVFQMPITLRIPAVSFTGALHTFDKIRAKELKVEVSLYQ